MKNFTFLMRFGRIIVGSKPTGLSISLQELITGQERIERSLYGFGDQPISNYLY